MFIAQFFWMILAWIVTRPFITDWLIARAVRTPYTHIYGPDGMSVYMRRYWLFNPYPTSGVWAWLPSVRIHHILREDMDRHLHDHPWNARTIVLRGHYEEERPVEDLTRQGWIRYLGGGATRAAFFRERGYTGRLLFGQYHRISLVSNGGVFTMFWTWKYQGTWGFNVDGVKVPYRQYLKAGKTE